VFDLVFDLKASELSLVNLVLVAELALRNDTVRAAFVRQPLLPIYDNTINAVTV